MKMVNMGELFEYPRIGDVDMERVPLSKQEAKRYLLKPGDLLFARQSLVYSGAGKCSVFLGASEPVTFEGHLIRARLQPSVGNPMFCFYFFNSTLGRKVIGQIIEQVAAAGIRGSDLAKLEVPYPPIKKQQSIGATLAVLDDKIELNHQMNQTLEAIARAIFKSWFVDFDPVWAKMDGQQPYGMDAKTAALFPAAFTDSEIGPIPKGWRDGTLGEIAKNPRRSVQPKDVAPGTPYIGLQHMPQRSVALTEWGEAQEVSSNKFSFARKEMLFGKLWPYFHKVGVAPLDGICSTDILVVIPKLQEWYSLLLCYLSSAEFVDYTTAVSTGTRMPRTNWRDMSKYEIVIPPQEVAFAFNQQIVPLVDPIQNNIFQSRTLAELRDTLLPKLISGQLRVPDAVKLVGGTQ